MLCDRKSTLHGGDVFATSWGIARWATSCTGLRRFGCQRSELGMIEILENKQGDERVCLTADAVSVSIRCLEVNTSIEFETRGELGELFCRAEGYWTSRAHLATPGSLQVV